MADLVTIEELRLFLKIPTLAAENAADVLAGVSAQIRRYTRRAWELTEDDEIRVNGRGGVLLLLPRLPVVEISEIVEDPDGRVGGPTTLASSAYEWDADGLVRRVDGGVFARRLRHYAVTYSHGEPVPDDVKLLALRVCARAAVNPEGLVQEQTAGYLSVFGQDASRLAVLGPADERELHEYRVTV